MKKRGLLWLLSLAVPVLVATAHQQDWQIVDSQVIAPGVFYQAMRCINPAVWVGVVRVPLPLPEGLTLTPSLGGGERFGRQPLSQIAGAIQQSKGYVAAGINADYFSMTFSPYAGDPLGLHIQNGELVSLPWVNRSTLVGLVDGRVFITRFGFSAKLSLPDGVEISLDGLNQPPPRNGVCLFTPSFGESTCTPPGTVELIANASLPLRPNSPLKLTVGQINETGNSQIPRDGVVLVATGDVAGKFKSLQPNERLEVLVTLTPLDCDFDPREIAWAVGGGPRILRNGQISVECEQEGFSTSFRQTRHPRTAVGLRDDALIWVVVDGRQPGYSEGMTLDELAQFLLNAGCKDALNLDGGGSSTLFVRGRVVNRPSDGRERPIANALFLLNLFPPQPIVRIWFSTPETHWLSGAAIPFQVLGEDAVYRLFTLGVDKVNLTVTPELEGWGWDGQTVWFPITQGEEPVQVTVTAVVKDGKANPATMNLCIHPKPSVLEIRPSAISVPPGASVKLELKVLGREKDGRLIPLRFDPSEVQWRVEGEVGKVVNGTFFSAQTPTARQGKVIAALKGVETALTVNVSVVQWLTLHEFDDASGLSFVGYPETVKVEGQIVTTEKRSGTGALLLRYDFSKGGRTRTASVLLNKTLPPNSTQLRVYVYGDGSGCWLRARVRDATGKPIFLDLVSSINWKNEWREVEVNLPSGLTEPITLEAIYLAVIRDEQKCSGSILLDSLRVSTVGLQK